MNAVTDPPPNFIFNTKVADDADCKYFHLLTLVTKIGHQLLKYCFAVFLQQIIYESKAY